MPTYTYRCTACGYTFDKRQAFTDSALTECPRCGARLRKVFGEIGVTFSGTGFYHTDSGSGAKPGSGTHHHVHIDSASGSKNGSSSAAKPESAPSTKGAAPKPASKTPATPTA